MNNLKGKQWKLLLGNEIDDSDLDIISEEIAEGKVEGEIEIEGTCDKCGEPFDGRFCSECGWENGLPTIGGYDPELDYDV